MKTQLTALLLCALTCTACKKDGTEPEAKNPPLPTVNEQTAQTLQNNNFVWTDMAAILRPTFPSYISIDFLARTFYDFDKDGDKDLLVANISPSEAPINVSYFKNNSGTFQLDNSVFGGNIPKYVHPRQALLGDFDNNGWMDVVIVGHGWDHPPAPGEKQKIMLNFNGSFVTRELPVPMVQNNARLAFTHSGASGDIDNDGDLDLFFTNNFGICGIVLTNDGKGNFSYDRSKFPDISDKPYFTSNMYDINKDGYIDLLILGHDNDPNVQSASLARPAVLWGGSDGKFTTNRITYLPATSKYGVSNSVNFIDFDNDGKTDVLIGKTGDGAPGSYPFYQGYYLQLLKNTGNNAFTDASASIQNNFAPGGIWIPWFLVKDIDNDNDPDIVADTREQNFQWRNNNGTFVKY